MNTVTCIPQGLLALAILAAVFIAIMRLGPEAL